MPLLLIPDASRNTFPTAATPNSNFPALAVEFSPTTNPLSGPVWVDITSKCRGVSIRRGRSREVDQFQAGSMALTLDNRDRSFDPEYTAGTYYGNLTPRKRFQVRAQYGNVTYPIMVGFAEAFPQQYRETTDATAPVTCADGFKILEGAVLTGSLYETIISQDSPTHRWKLDEPVGSSTAVDRGVGTLVPGRYLTNVTLGSTALVPYDGGAPSASFAPTGINDGVVKVDLGNALPTSSTWTIELWAKVTAAIAFAGAAPFLINLGSFWSGVNPHATIYLANGSTPVGELGVQVGTSTNATANVGTTSAFNDGIAHHIVLTWVDSTRTATLYVDGVLIGSQAAASGTVAFTNQTFTIGNDLDPLVGYIAGHESVLAEVAIYDGRALSATRVAAHYNAGMTALLDTTGTRFGRILDHAGWPTSDRNIDPGITTLAAYDISAQTDLTYSQLLATTEQGQFYVDRAGLMTWRQRHALLTATRSTTSKATFGDGAGELGYHDLILNYDDQLLRNTVTIQRSGGISQISTDTASVTSYGQQGYSQTGLLFQNDAEALNCAQWLVAHFKSPLTRVDAVVLKPAGDATHIWPAVLDLEIGDRITVNRRPQGVGAVISKQLIVEGIEHAISPEDWTVTLRCSPAETQQYWVLDDTTLSVLDSTTRVAF